MHRNKSVDVHQFAMIPRAEIPRSSFRIQTSHKTTFESGFLIPIYVTEVLPGDTFSLRMTAFARMATPIFPIMDNAYLDTFFFFVPNRLLWTNWVRFMGEQPDNPSQSISFTVPQIVSPAGGFARDNIYDYFGIPCTGQVLGGNTISINALPLRAYAQIYNEWFRDENLQTSFPKNVGDGPDTFSDYVIVRRGKRHDYFTSCLPWVQKGGAAAAFLPSQAVIRTAATVPGAPSGAQTPVSFRRADTGGTPGTNQAGYNTTFGDLMVNATAFAGGVAGVYPYNLYADLSGANGTINQLRQAFQIQKLLERDARGGTRYTEIVRSHFGVISPDARLQRPEYLGGGTQAIGISAIPQTSATGLTGGTSPIGSLAAYGQSVGNGGFSQSFTEHGYIIGLANVRADLNYQNGLRKMWSRSTRYDFYFPVFAHLGEQAVLNREIYADGSANDALVFGYQERWGEYRYQPSMVTGFFNSRHATPLDTWHLAQNFVALPTLNATFISETPPFSRILAAGAGAVNQQFLCDFFFDIKAARPMPLYSVPGMIDHF